MLKKLILASAMLASVGAYAQDNTDISGANFQSGKADGTLAALGRKAAASGSRLVITAPPEWHARIAAKVKAGGAAEVVMRDGFYETVLVRVESKAAQQAAAAKTADADRASKAEADKAKADAARADAARAEAERAKAEAERIKAEAEKAKAEAELARSRAEAEKAQAEAAKARAEAARAATARSATPAPAAPAGAAAPAAKLAAAASTGQQAAKERLQTAINGGRDIVDALAIAQLQSGDLIYVDGDVRAVQRRLGQRRVAYWLEGDLDLRRSELKPIAKDRYQVMSIVRGTGELRKEFAGGAGSLALREPAATSPARTALQQSIHEGRDITETIEPVRLRSGDVVFVNGDAAAVVRRRGNDLLAFWLVGEFDVQQAGIRADGTDKYKVMSDTVR
jgi:hypothetical protein